MVPRVCKKGFHVPYEKKHKLCPATEGPFWVVSVSGTAVVVHMGKRAGTIVAR